MSWFLSAGNLVANGAKDFGKMTAFGGVMSGGFHGFLGYATYDGNVNDPLNQAKKMGYAFAADNIVDAAGYATTGIASYGAGAAAGGIANAFGAKTATSGLARVGAWASKGAKIGGWGWMAASMAATFTGLDPSTLVQTAYDSLEQSYTRRKYGMNGFNLSQSSSSHVQQQVQRLSQTSNPAEAMHN